MECIDKIVYINLQHREDRKKEILEEFKKYDFPKDKIVRFQAIYTHGFGSLGCAKSHLAVLKMAKENQWKNILILEDDFHIVVPKEEFHQSLNYFFHHIVQQYPWDVMMLAYSGRILESFHDDPIIGRIRFGQTASAYLVNSSYYDVIIENIETGCQLLEETGRHWDFANDICWSVLQERDHWYYFKKRLSIQRPSYSDNSDSFQDYGR